jgi:chorismate dehydratase
MLRAPVVSPIRLGVVRYVNTLPLVDGLERLRDVELHEAVPSRLIGMLGAGDVDLALCSSIDYQRSPQPLVIVPAGLLGCDGPTLTVRLYSTRPLEAAAEIACDADSHTSVVLLQILMRERFGVAPRIIEYDGGAGASAPPEALLLIGDKVVTQAPPADRYPHQADLGAMWKELTGLPFVFAAWMARADALPDRLDVAAAVLDRQRRRNAQRLDAIVHARAAPRGWPRELAARYVRELIRYEWTGDMERALDSFFAKADEHGLVRRTRAIDLAACATVR